MTSLQVINNTVPSALISDREVEFELQVSSANLLNLLDILKSHSLTKLVNLVELTCY